MDKIFYQIKKIIPKKLFRVLQPCYHFTLAWLAALLYRFPSNNLIVIGVTGTTGKTTSVYLIAKMLENAGYRTGYTSTAMFNDGKREWLNDKKMTMVGRVFTQRMLKKMVKNDCRYAVIETTSEGIVQFRHKFINYDILVFTGLYPEHIESHGNFENYMQVKGKLFAHLKRCGKKYVDEAKRVKKVAGGIAKLKYNQVKKVIIANGDDEHAPYFFSFWAEEKIAYTSRKKELGENIAVIDYSDIRLGGQGISFYTKNTRINLNLLGDFNAINAMNAVGIGIVEGLKMEAIKNGLESIDGVAGRLERINEGQSFIVIVDYAFEPRAVIKLYDTIRHIPHRRTIHVLGSAGGGRDVARRPVLGELAGENADVVIITNEDPYDDDPQEIIDQVAGGALKKGKKIEKNLFMILDRREAIKKAIETAQENDIVLITGKGSEQAICVKDGEKVPWDDRAIVRGIISEKNLR